PDYFVDLLFRPGDAAPVAGRPTAQAATADTAAPSSIAPPPPLSPEARAEVTRIMLRGVPQGRIEDQDRAYLARLIAARTGLPPDAAARRVTEVESKARETVKETAEKAAKAGAYVSFWTFMSLLFGGASATLA